MSTEIKVPPLGESVSEATIAKWYKKPGEFVKSNDLLLELETDKVTLEVNAEVSGVLKTVNMQVGQTVTPGEILGVIEAGEQGSVVVESKMTLESKAQSEQKSEQILSPAASKIAKENAVNVESISGSGKDGRITKGDVLDAVKSPKHTSNQIREERVKMSRLRQRIAQRLKESQNTAAILTTFNEVDMSNIMNLRNKYKDIFEKKHGVKLGFMSFFVKASIAALKEFPSVNAEIDGEDIIYKNYYDLGVAVGTPQGLVVPVVRDADMMSFADIEKEISALGIKARDGKLSMQELTGGTFTISNGGVYGSLLSTPIINPPQSGILGMHKTEQRPVVIDNKIEIRPMMYIALSYDHRIIDGKEAVTFLVRIKESIENPERLLFDL